MPTNSTNLIWIDLEMTGLDPDQHKIIEIATIVTDSELNILAEGPVLAVQQSEAELAKMDEWNQTTHGNSGLIERVRHHSVSCREAEQQTLAFLQQWVDQGASPICGNSVGQDRRFLVNYMPELESYFHYRTIDVSTIKELVRRWQPTLLNEFTKSDSHQALEDIRGSIAELSFYRQKVFTI